MSAKSRRQARRILLQALYQLQVGGHTAEQLLEQFVASPEAKRADIEYFTEVLEFVAENQTELDESIAAFGDMPAHRLDPVEHSILWVAIAELREQPDVPTKVVINEAIELAKAFGAEGGYRYINGLLDKAAATLRSAA
jgi:N utilization substance protein B